MKATASIQTPMFFNSTLPTTGTWGNTSQPIARRQLAAARPAKLTTDDLDASKPELVCGGILGLCLLYTFVHCFAQLAF